MRRKMITWSSTCGVLNGNINQRHVSLHCGAGAQLRCSGYRPRFVVYHHIVESQDMTKFWFSLVLSYITFANQSSSPLWKREN